MLTEYGEEVVQLPDVQLDAVVPQTVSRGNGGIGWRGRDGVTSMDNEVVEIRQRTTYGVYDVWRNGGRRDGEEDGRMVGKAEKVRDRKGKEEMKGDGHGHVAELT